MRRTDRPAVRLARRRLLIAAPLLTSTTFAFAQVPARLRIILTAPPGSSIDVLGRVIGD
jgi:tripartite-type tricarboxylate transporter receptor subunit TctC